MSSIDSVIISISSNEETIGSCVLNGSYKEYPILVEINKWFQDNAFAKEKELFNIDMPAVLQANVWVISSGSGGLYLRDFLMFIANLTWNDPECGQVFIKQEHDKIFDVYNVNELQIRRNSKKPLMHE